MLTKTNEFDALLLLLIDRKYLSIKASVILVEINIKVKSSD